MLRVSSRECYSKVLLSEVFPGKAADDIFFPDVPVVPLVVGCRGNCMPTYMQRYVNRRCAHVMLTCSFAPRARTVLVNDVRVVSLARRLHLFHRRTPPLLCPDAWYARLFELLNGTCASGEVPILCVVDIHRPAHPPFYSSSALSVCGVYPAQVQRTTGLSVGDQ